jgi:DNA-directed RNA polymerase specialized sigma24 family protein
MSTARASDHSPVSMSNLAGRALASLSIPMLDELCRDAISGTMRLRGRLEALFEDRFGQQPDFERLRFLFFAAPLVRRMVIASANLNGRVAGTDITFADVKSWLEWLDSMDPLCARMIDLRYFGGLTVKESATLLDLPPAAIVRELRFARAWLRLKDCP